MTYDNNDLEITASNMGMQQKQLVKQSDEVNTEDFPQSTDNTNDGQQEQAQLAQQAQLAYTYCPNCGAATDPDCDYCESCHTYIRHDICSFCGAHIEGIEGFCPECGNPLGGIVCPLCRTMNDFAFCKQCGTPLTDEAKIMLEHLKQTPEYQEVMTLVKEIDTLDKIIPCTSEQDAERDKRNTELRRRVLRLLAMDNGIESPVIEDNSTKRISVEQLKQQKTDVMLNLSKALAKLETQPTASPSHARNYAMATKPAGVRLGWVCNYKHALHNSPCGCAKPQMGGKWVVLGKGDVDKIKNDF